MSSRKKNIFITFQNWLMEFARYREYSGTLQNFIEYACSDIKFPVIWPTDKDKIIFYLNINGACKESIDAFELLWTDYISDN
jgi:uncharacterized protein YozE (UPF0346 family)